MYFFDTVAVVVAFVASVAVVAAAFPGI
ncbi:hypothetical protein A2U01_0073914 [Trifolium medium]|uniref:Uncharacterized protein n=1 Tax=Trifolium medium TaxID=97028 RepID=A0A392SUW8_9FABA|nr:hypothetical protein [Trifolium medium]